MSRPSKWWWGLLPLAILWLLAIFVKTTAVEEDVHARAGVTVAASDLEVEVAGRDVTLAGTLLTEETRDAVEDTRGVRLVRGDVREGLGEVEKDGALAAADAAAETAETSSAATRGPAYDWSLHRDGDVLVLSGGAPSASARDRIAGAARAAFPGIEIRDEMVVTADAPGGSEEAALYALDQVARLPDGRVSLSGGEYSIAGTAPTPEVYEELLAEMRDLPEGLTLGGVDVLPPGESTGRGEDATGEVAESDETDDSVERAERVASAETGARTEAAERAEGSGRAGSSERTGAAESTERVAEAERVEGAESADGTERTAGTERAAGTESVTGTETVAGEETAAGTESAAGVEGVGRSEGAETVAETIDAESSEVGEAGTATANAAGGAAPAEAGSCQQRFAEVLERSRFRFETGSSALSVEATGALDELATVAGSCPEIHGESIELVIAGHTDAVGPEAFNLDLSRRRAQATVDHLTRAGVPAARLTSTGYGESRPVASNDTEAGRAQNRRIEIEVR